MPKSRSKVKRTKSKAFKPTKQLFVAVAIAVLVIFVIFLMELPGQKADAGSGPAQINPASDMTVDSPFGY